MYLCYFVVDAQDQLHKAPADIIEAIWRGTQTTQTLGFGLGDQFRLVTVLCDDESLQPQMCFFLRTQLKDGSITDRSRFSAYEAVTRHLRRRYDTLAANHQLVGWPRSWQRQLAVALDVPASQLHRIGIGGPLLMSDLWGLSISEVLEYFERVTGG